MKIHNTSMLSHGAGAILEITIGENRFTGKRIKIGMGGYGNIPAPFGTFTWIPKYIYYRRSALHLCFVNIIVSIIFQ